MPVPKRKMLRIKINQRKASARRVLHCWTCGGSFAMKSTRASVFIESLPLLNRYNKVCSVLRSDSLFFLICAFFLFLLDRVVSRLTCFSFVSVVVADKNRQELWYFLNIYTFSLSFGSEFYLCGSGCRPKASCGCGSKRNIYCGSGSKLLKKSQCCL
jgi:hypothetical protein